MLEEVGAGVFGAGVDVGIFGAGVVVFVLLEHNGKHNE